MRTTGRPHGRPPRWFIADRSGLRTCRCRSSRCRSRRCRCSRSGIRRSRGRRSRVMIMVVVHYHPVAMSAATHRSLGRDRLSAISRRLRIGRRLLDAGRSRLRLLSSRLRSLGRSLSRRRRLLSLVRSVHRLLSRIRRLRTTGQQRQTERHPGQPYQSRSFTHKPFHPYHPPSYVRPGSEKKRMKSSFRL